MDVRVTTEVRWGHHYHLKVRLSLSTSHRGKAGGHHRSLSGLERESQQGRVER